MKIVQPTYLLAASLALVGACNEKKKATPSSPAYDLEIPQGAPEGPHYEDPDFSLEVARPELCDPGGVLGPASSLRRLAIPVKIAVKGGRAIPVGPMLFTVISDDRSYSPTLASCRAPFKAQTLEAGDTVEAHVAFDLPETSPQLELHFEPFIIGRKKIEARVIVPGL